MVDSKENYKFDLTVKGLNSDGDDWSSLHSPPPPSPRKWCDPQSPLTLFRRYSLRQEDGLLPTCSRTFLPKVLFRLRFTFGGGGEVRLDVSYRW